MTDIQKRQKEQREKVKSYINEKDQKTLAAFEEQKESIQKIQWTAWFSFIRQYWLKQEMLAIDLLWEKIDADDLKSIAEAKARYKLAKEFNQYLNVRG